MRELRVNSVVMTTGTKIQGILTYDTSLKYLFYNYLSLFNTCAYDIGQTKYFFFIIIFFYKKEKNKNTAYGQGIEKAPALETTR